MDPEYNVASRDDCRQISEADTAPEHCRIPEEEVKETIVTIDEFKGDLIDYIEFRTVKTTGEKNDVKWLIRSIDKRSLSIQLTFEEGQIIED